FASSLRSNVRLMRPGMAVIILSGKYAGRKAIIIKNYDDGSAQKPYGHALVVGIDRYPRRILRKMSKKRVEGRSKIKPFIKLVNYNHIMPTRHTIDIQFNTSVVNKNSLVDKPKKRTALLEAKMKLQERYRTNENPWLFRKLRF
ncbi:60S ribosomal protein L27, partial [Taenia solium]